MGVRHLTIQWMAKSRKRHRCLRLSRAQIYEHVWDIHFDTASNVVDVYVNMLRKAIDQPFQQKLIHTVIGVGYVLRDE